MNYIEYGRGNPEVVMLLHGGGLSWWNFRQAAQLLQKDFHVILPILDGHAGSDRPFTTMEDNAEEIIDFIRQELGGSVLLLGGVSLGAQILLEMLSRQGDICRYALVESALAVPSRLTAALIGPTFGSCYGLIRHRWFARLQFWYLGIRSDLFEDYYRDTCAITRQNMIAFLRANSLYSLKPSLENCTGSVRVLVGGKEYPAMKTSARRIRDRIPGSTLQVLKGMKHGELALNHGLDYAREIYETLGR